MTSHVATVTPDATYQGVVNVLADRGVSAVPVVDADQRVVGVVSEADLLRRIERPAQPPRPRLLERRRERAARTKAGAGTAKELMTAPAVTATPDMSIGEAARLMESSGVKRLPVVDDRGRLAGIVSRRDLLRVFHRIDNDIRGDIIDDITSALSLAPDDITVAVTSGVATLRGELELRSQARVAVHLARAVVGVVDVVDELRYAYDDTDRKVRPHDS